MKITVGFSKAKSWWAIGSKAIAMAEKRPFSHSYVKYNCPVTGIELVVQASHGCVNITNYERFKITNIVVEEYTFEVDSDRFQGFMEYINRMVGAPYSTTQILCLAIKKVFRIELNVHNKSLEFICSELSSKICEVLEILEPVVDQDYITPSDFNKLIKKKING